MDILNGNEVTNSRYARTQVFQATHDARDNRLSLMNRSFISFTYGGKNIEDFNLIAIIENNSLDKSIYSEFQDQVTNSEILDGQFYWSTHFKNNSLDLTLFTDEITEKQLTSFSQWFKPGFARELILAEHPNRAIIARIGTPPQYHMLPFEKKFISKIYGTQTSTTVYKGKINLSFVMDDPFWYSLTNMLDQEVAGKWRNISTKQLENIASSRDALKIIEEDGIPTSLSLKGDLLIGNNVLVTVTHTPARVWRYGDTKTDVPEAYIGAIIGGRSTVSTNDSGFTLAANTDKYFYYAGTAPCAPIIKFSIDFDTNGTSHSIQVGNTYSSSNTPYSSIFIQSVTAERELRFTTPSLITAYNQAISLGSSATAEEKRDKINHYKVRAAAINNGLTSLFNGITTADFTINCKTGETKVTYHLKTGELTEEAGDMIRSNYLKIEDRNYPDENGYIHTWTSNNPEYSHKLWHNVPSGLKKVSLTYKHMYL